MRGKGRRVPLKPGGAGITPAHAGKSMRRRRIKNRVKDHPRPCGEKIVIITEVTPMIGSPPPMRGKVVVTHDTLFQRRITPAHAGKSMSSMAAAAAEVDHPRPCGEKLTKVWSIPDAKGSPPPMRGKAPKPKPKPAAPGITPAHAGKS